MTRLYTSIACLLIVATPRILSQPTKVSAPSFEVASVKRLPPPGDEITVIMRAERGVLNYSYVTIKSLVLRAFELKSMQISGPNWLGSEYYEIKAKYQPDLPKAQVPDLLKGLLSDRFQLQFHWESREMPIYALVIAKGGAKLPPGVPEDAGVRLSTGPEGVQMNGTGTMKRLADAISGSTDRPVFDQTGLQGLFAIQLEWNPDSDREGALGDAGGPSIFTALREQLGLKVEARKGPVQFFVIDHVLRVPLEN